MEIRTADLEDIATYTALGRAAQAWLQSRGLEQYVPAAHDEYADAIRARVAAGTLFAVVAVRRGPGTIPGGDGRRPLRPWDRRIYRPLVRRPGRTPGVYGLAIGLPRRQPVAVQVLRVSRFRSPVPGRATPRLRRLPVRVGGSARRGQQSRHRPAKVLIFFDDRRVE
jgi:hypothetical protein